MSASLTISVLEAEGVFEKGPPRTSCQEKFGLNTDPFSSRTGTALHLACTRGQSSVVALLIQWRCDLDASDEEGKTALIKAVQCRKEVCVTILLEHGADPNLVDDCQNTALHYAVLAEDTSIAAKLLHYKANIEAINKYKYTPLLLAIRENKEEMVKFLIENGANVHAVDKLQRSALMLAVHHDSPEIVKLLLEKRVNTDLLDLHGWFAGRYACYNGFKHLYQLIVDYRARRIPNTPPQNSDLGQSSAKKSLPSSHTGAENIQEKLQLSGKDDKEEMVVKLGTSNGSCMDPLKNVEQKTDLVVEISPSHEDISVIRVSPKRDIDDSRPPSDDDLALAPKDTMDFELSDPKDSSEVLPQQLPEAERHFRGPEIELHPRRDALRPTTLVLQCVHRDRGQAQRSNKETEPLSQSKQGDVIKYIAKQPFLKETIWKLQSENTLLRQQLEVARNEARSKKTIFNTPEPFLDHMGKLEAMSTRVLMLEEGNKELIKECRCLKDRLCQYETDRAEMEARMRQLQQELADTRKKVSTLEASLEVTAHHQTNSENKRQDGERKPHQTANPDADLPAKEESTSSVLLHLSAETQLLLKEILSVKQMQKKCEALEEEKKKLEEEAVNLRRHLEMNTVDHSQVEQDKRETEEQTRRDVVKTLKKFRRAVQYRRETEEQGRHDVLEKLKEISQFLQAQAALQENVLRECRRASVSQTEQRAKDLEPELKSDSDENRWEKYKQMYLEELENRKSLASQLTSVNERLAEMSSKLQLERQPKSSFPGFVPTRPVGEPPSAAGTSAEAKGSPTRRRRFRTFSEPSTNLSDALFRMQKELENNADRELKEATTELES